MTNRMLNTAEPTIEPMPGFASLTNMLTSEMNTSGAELPMAMNVAPATSWSKFNF